MNTGTQATPESKKGVAAVQAKTWQYFLLADPQEAASFANLEPAQQAGEASFSVREDGQTDTFLFF